MEYTIKAIDNGRFAVIKEISLTGRSATEQVCDFGTYVEAYQIRNALQKAFNIGMMIERIKKVKARLEELKS